MGCFGIVGVMASLVGVAIVSRPPALTGGSHWSLPHLMGEPVPGFRETLNPTGDIPGPHGHRGRQCRTTDLALTINAMLAKGLHAIFVPCKLTEPAIHRGPGLSHISRLCGSSLCHHQIYWRQRGAPLPCPLVPYYGRPHVNSSTAGDFLGTVPFIQAGLF